MKILIVENDKNDLINLYSLLDDFGETNHIQIEKVIENEREKILDNSSNFDIAFFDIELDNNKNGIELACELRKINKDIRIIFVSNYNKYLIDGYKARADLYLLKPINQDQFNLEMYEITRDYLNRDAGITDLKYSQTKIYFRDILYIEVLARKLNLHLVDGQIISKFDTLKRWMDLLKECSFSQPHRAFLINLEHVQHLYKDHIIMDNEELIQITDSYRDRFRKDYILYLNRKV